MPRSLRAQWTKIVCLATAGVLLFARVAAAPPDWDAAAPVDPVFNLPYDPAQVHFDSIDISALAACAPLLPPAAEARQRVTLFGRLDSGRDRILIIGDERPAPRGQSGAVLVLRGDACRSSSPLFALRRMQAADPDLDPGLSATEVGLLMQDVFARYARAFGGKPAFLAWLSQGSQAADVRDSTMPGVPCPLITTRFFTPQMKRVLDAYRSS